MNETTTDIEHPLAKIEAEIVKEAARLLRRPPSTVEAVGSELAGTVMSLFRDYAKATREQLEWLFESLAAAHERIDELEEGETQFTPEDAAKFAEVLEGSIVVLEEVFKAAEGGYSAAEKAKMQGLIEKAKECRQIVEDGTLEEEDEEDGDDEEGEDEEPSPAN